MDCSPLNLAHFHERRANKFMRQDRYDDAAKALQTALIYLQDAYKRVIFPQSIIVLNTQKWEYERKMRQIQIRKQQYERSKMEIMPLSETNSIMVMRSDSNSGSAQSVAKSIDKTVREFDAKFSLPSLEQKMRHLKFGKENFERKRNSLTDLEATTPRRTSSSKSKLHEDILHAETRDRYAMDDTDEMLSLVPLELPAFDMHTFSTSTTSLPSIAGLAENFQK